MKDFFFDVTRTSVMTTEGRVDLPMFFFDSSARLLNFFVDYDRTLPMLDKTGLEPVRFLKDSLGFAHLSTITGLDKNDVFEVLYHFANEYLSLSVRITTPRNEPVIPSICEVIPGAILYERELQDMFGIVVENIPDPRPLVLPDDWEQGVYPLRKDWTFERPEEVIPGGE
jgi:Ni,Fe-hydrogenase III component G